MDLKEKGYNRRERMEWLVIMLVVSLLCMIPCMGKLLPQGDDMTFHILRIESVYHAIKTGQGFPAYIYDKLLEGYGYHKYMQGNPVRSLLHCHRQEP